MTNFSTDISAAVVHSRPTMQSCCQPEKQGINDRQTKVQMETRQTEPNRENTSKTFASAWFWFHPLEDVDNINNFVTLLGKLCKCGKGRLEVINFSDVSSKPCRLRRAGLYNMHVRSNDETTP